jgi:hypothetical protein
MRRATDFWYSAKTALDWLVCHYGLGGTHFAWFSPEFDTYRKPNPQSSNPHTLYHGYMSAWRDNDEFSQYVGAKRLSLCNAVEKNVDLGKLERHAANELKEGIEIADISFFYPIVYQIDLRKISMDRIQTNVGSGAGGSHECLILDLQEEEFDLLFAHFREDRLFGQMVLDGHGDGAYHERHELLDIIQQRQLKP